MNFKRRIKSYENLYFLIVAFAIDFGFILSRIIFNTLPIFLKELSNAVILVCTLLISIDMLIIMFIRLFEPKKIRKKK